MEEASQKPHQLNRFLLWLPSSPRNIASLLRRPRHPAEQYPSDVAPDCSSIHEQLRLVTPTRRTPLSLAAPAIALSRARLGLNGHRLLARTVLPAVRTNFYDEQRPESLPRLDFVRLQLSSL